MKKEILLLLFLMAGGFTVYNFIPFPEEFSKNDSQFYDGKENEDSEVYNTIENSSNSNLLNFDNSLIKETVNAELEPNPDNPGISELCTTSAEIFFFKYFLNTALIEGCLISEIFLTLSFLKYLSL